MPKNIDNPTIDVTLYRVTTVTRRGAMPRTVRVAATTKAAAAAMAQRDHRVLADLPASASITVVACRATGATVI